jgi:hypothetical protein
MFLRARVGERKKTIGLDNVFHVYISAADNSILLAGREGLLCDFEKKRS